MNDPKCSGCACTLSEEEITKRLDDIIEEYRDKPGGLIPALQIVQSLLGYLPDKVIRYLSNGFHKSYSEVAGIVSFYSFFSTTPRGKYIIRVCLGTACYVRGGKQILENLKQELGIDVGETTEDRMFTLSIARCFGACGLAPVITINDDIHQRVKGAKVRDILKYYREKDSQGKEMN
ncbi:MAG: NAD(P)H-dependent oxidoreductase subunit E [Candidatus Auribacterota bacterium]|jgi:NADH:ubiquinone oxidoreductase subunit E|nr:NAD(P)H-dependent oxidoreductase subunit E [Candidatus Auribacterota bacterium]